MACQDRVNQGITIPKSDMSDSELDGHIAILAKDIFGVAAQDVVSRLAGPLRIPLAPPKGVAIEKWKQFQDALEVRKSRQQ